jgi:cystathionine beta-lyase/cystathionine gamma-synthase
MTKDEFKTLLISIGLESSAPLVKDLESAFAVARAEKE